MVQNPSLKKQVTTDYVHKLERACKWLDIEQGRARAYLYLLREFDRRSQLCDAHLLSYYESCEIVELFELWETRINAFPGLEAKIRRACRQGPVLRENENVSSSANRPRNDAFAFVMRAVSTSVRQPVSEFTEAPPRARSGKGPGRREAVAVCV